MKINKIRSLEYLKIAFLSTQDSPGKPRRAQGELRRAQDSPGQPRKAQESPGEPRKAQESPGEPRRIQDSPGEPRRAQESPELSHICTLQQGESEASSSVPLDKGGRGVEKP